MGDRARRIAVCALPLCLLFQMASYADSIAAFAREVNGPFESLLLRSVFIRDGSGSAVQGPVDILIKRDRIAKIERSIASRDLPQGTIEVWLKGRFILPGFVDAHAHTRVGLLPSDYMGRLWLAHGITTIRVVDSWHYLGDNRELQTQGAQARTLMPRIYLYPDVTNENRLVTPKLLLDSGVDGLKTFANGPLDQLTELFALAVARGVRVASHVKGSLNAVQLADMGLTSLEHLFGIPQAIGGYGAVFVPATGTNTDTADFFRRWGRSWLQAMEAPQSEIDAVVHHLVQRGITLVPTISVYSALRDVTAARDANWQVAYTFPSLWTWFEPSLTSGYGFWYDWSTTDQVLWTQVIRGWDVFLAKYRHAGGSIAVGSDAGFMYNVPGFGYIHEMILLQEAGLSAMDVISAATSTGAELLGEQSEFGTVEVGKRADLVICDRDPEQDLASLYATGSYHLDEAGRIEKTPSIEYVLKSGTVYNAELLRRAIVEEVARAKREIW